MKVIQRVVFLFSCFLGAWVLAAEQVTKLGEIQVWVADNTQNTRSRALAVGLSEVIVRITGTVTSLDHPAVSNLLKNPATYLQEYTYDRQAKPAGQGYAVENRAVKQSGQEQLLKLKFDEKALKQVLKRAQLPIWSNNRPRLIVWWGQDQIGRRDILSRDSGYSEVDAFIQSAKRRAIPLILPLIDFEDQKLVNSGEVFGFVIPPIEQASVRYAADALLVGRIKSIRQEKWQGSWMLVVNGESYWFEDLGHSAKELIDKAVASAAEQMSSLYAMVMNDQSLSKTVVRVLNVSDINKFDQVYWYLDRLVPVNTVRLVHVREDSLTFALELETSVEKFKQVLAYDQKLAPIQTVITDIAKQTGSASALEYHWLGD